MTTPEILPPLEIFKDLSSQDTGEFVVVSPQSVRDFAEVHTLDVREASLAFAYMSGAMKKLLDYEIIWGRQRHGSPQFSDMNWAIKPEDFSDFVKYLEAHPHDPNGIGPVRLGILQIIAHAVEEGLVQNDEA